MQSTTIKLCYKNLRNVYIADNEHLEMLGKRKVEVKTTNCEQWKLQDVRYIPGLKKKLKYLSQSDNTRYNTTFGKGAAIITRGRKWDLDINPQRATLQS